MDLLPCPFCGEQAKLHYDEGVFDEPEGVFFAQCFGCGARSGYARYESEVVALWNTRTYPLETD